MEVLRLDDPRKWLALAEPLLLEDEARNDLPLGIADTLIRHPSVYPSRHLWVVEDGRRAVVAVARAILDAGIQLPGVTGAEPEASGFAGEWLGLTGGASRTVGGQGVY